MDNKEELLTLYSEFMKTKENFVNRSFATNKFYIVGISICILAMAIVREFFVRNIVGLLPGNSLIVMALALIGMTFSLLLWANQDAYAYLLRIKFSAVIDKLEEQLCFQPCIKEKEAIIEQAKKKRNYVFADVQKTFALMMFAIFLAAFLWDLVPRILLAFDAMFAY